jgi:hypothetical protein
VSDRRARDVEALEERVRDLGEDVKRLVDREAQFVFDGDEVAARETRNLAALYRDRAATLVERSRQLRVELDPRRVTSPFPMQITRRVG